jgi:tRNA (guanine-N7-)-methyltransferase
MPAKAPVMPAPCPGVAGGGVDAMAGLFSREAPLVLDLGCGNGLFLAGLAACEPGWNVLGIEKKEYRVRQARRRAGDLGNARVLHGEVLEVLSSLLPGSVSRVYLLFSDPWPKRRHAVRRLVQEEFVALLYSRLEAGGTFFFATDAEEYLAWTQEKLSVNGWQIKEWAVPETWPMTEFEQRFASAGLNIWRLQASR